MDIFSIVVLLLAAAGYVAPSMVAVARRHSAMWWIIGLNVAFGWTVIGWAALILWAFTGARRHQYEGWA